MDKIKRFSAVFLLILAIPFLIPAVAWCQDSPALCDGRMTVKIDSTSSRSIPYCSNYNVEGKNGSTIRAVIVIHGVDRNAVDYYHYVKNAAETAGALSETIIIAPQFLLKKDITATAVKNLIVWPDDVTGFDRSEVWSRGDNSCKDESTCPGSGAGTISSYAVIDRILDKLSDRTLFPRLTRIIITGHSAGGQFVNRYAAGNQAEGKVAQKRISMRYVTANPSSYLYFNRERWDNKSDKPLFQYNVPTPEAVDDCPHYNEYRYGLEKLNPYMAAAGAWKIPLQYWQRKVVHLLGGADTDGPHLDTSCEANFQGTFRLMRGYVYYNYLYHYFRTVSLPNQSLVTVPGVAHDGDQIFNSECGRMCLFDRSSYPGDEPFSATTSSTPSCGHICGH